jgi:hypothetical protein
VIHISVDTDERVRREIENEVSLLTPSSSFQVVLRRAQALGLYVETKDMLASIRMSKTIRRMTPLIIKVVKIVVVLLYRELIPLHVPTNWPTLL